MQLSSTVQITWIVTLTIGGLIFAWLARFMIGPCIGRLCCDAYRRKVHNELDALDQKDIEAAITVVYDPVTGEVVFDPRANKGSNQESKESDANAADENKIGIYVPMPSNEQKEYVPYVPKSKKRKKKLHYDENPRRKARLEILRQDYDEFQKAIKKAQTVASIEEQQESGKFKFISSILSKNSVMGWHLSRSQWFSVPDEVRETLYIRRHSNYFHSIVKENKDYSDLKMEYRKNRRAFEIPDVDNSTLGTEFTNFNVQRQMDKLTRNIELYKKSKQRGREMVENDDDMSALTS